MKIYGSDDRAYEEKGVAWMPFRDEYGSIALLLLYMELTSLEQYWRLVDTIVHTWRKTGMEKEWYSNIVKKCISKDEF